MCSRETVILDEPAATIRSPLSQVPENLSEDAPSVGSSETWHVLQQDETRSHFANHAPHVRPEVTLVVAAEARARDGERGAREARSDEIHCASPARSIERAQVVPYGGVVQVAAVHPGAQYADRERRRLDVADRTNPEGAQTGGDAADPGT